jgi:hypothetical protein
VRRARAAVGAVGRTAAAQQAPCPAGCRVLPARRSTSGLGKGDGIHDHTTKWLQVRRLAALPPARAVPRRTSHRHRLLGWCAPVLRVALARSLHRPVCHHQGDIKSPLEYIQEAAPIKVSGAVVASYGSEWVAGAQRMHAAADRHVCMCSLLARRPDRIPCCCLGLSQATTPRSAAP